MTPFCPPVGSTACTRTVTANCACPSTAPVFALACGITGIWTSAPTCDAGACPAPVLAYGSATCSGMVAAGGGCSLSCNAGYTNSGSATVTCLGNGAWSGTGACVPDPAYCPDESAFGFVSLYGAWHISDNTGICSPLCLNANTLSGGCFSAQGSLIPYRVLSDCGGAGTLHGGGLHIAMAAALPAFADFAGAYQEDDAVPTGIGCRLANPYTGGCSCPSSTSTIGLRSIVDVSGGVVGSFITLCYYHTFTVTSPVTFGGAYQIVDTGAVCLVSNPVTGGCSCPAGFVGQGLRMIVDPSPATSMAYICIRPWWSTKHVAACDRALDGTCVYACNTGYTALNSATTTCQSGGAWSATPPVCTAETCPTLTIPNGIASCSGTTTGSTCTLTCNLGYTLAGASAVTCESTNTWDTPGACVLTTEYCPPMTAPMNGTMTCTSHSLGGVCVFACNAGFVVVGATAAGCGVPGWNATAPTCSRVSCGTFTPALATPTCAGNLYTDFCTVNCTSANTTLAGPSTVTCRSDASWTPSGTCRSTLGACSALTTSTSGTVSCANAFTCSFGCLPGFSTTSAPVCTSGAWTHLFGSCSAINCGAPPAPSNGFALACATTTFGSTCLVGCNTYFALSGSASVTCLSSGSWSTLGATCVDNVAPRVLFTTPASGSKIAVSASIVVQFSEPVVFSGGLVATWVSEYGNPTSSVVQSGGGLTATLSSTTLRKGTVYRISLTGVVDAQGLALVPPDIMFVTQDVTAPVLLATSPTSGALGVDLAATVDLFFSVAMAASPTAAAFSLVVAQSGAGVSGAMALNPAMTRARFTPGAALLPSTEYLATVATAAQSRDGVALAAGATFRFTTRGNGAPGVVSITPSDGSLHLPLTTPIVIVFATPMSLANAEAAFSLKPTGSSTAVVGTFSWTSDFLTMTFLPTGGLASGTYYTILLAAGAVDVNLVVIGTSSTAQFKTKYTTPPVVVSHSPLSNAVGVARMPVITVTFSAPMTTSAIPSAALSLLQSGAAVTLGTAVWTSPTTLQVSPVSNLAEAVICYFTVNPSFRDEDGNVMAAPLSFAFTIRDSTPPTVLAVNPVNGAIDVSTTTSISITFSKPMNQAATQLAFALTLGGSIPGSFSWLTTSSVSFTPSFELSSGTLYTVSVSTAAQDLSSNALGAALSATFLTIDLLAPTVVSVSPSNGAVNEPVSSVIAVTFSKVMSQAVTVGAITITPATAATASWSASGKILTLTPTPALQDGVTFVVQCSTAAKDSYGNALSAAKSWTFDTISLATPTVTFVSPVNGAVGVGIAFAVQIRFSISMTRAATEAAIRVTNPGGTAVAGSISWSGTDTLAVFAPTTAFASATLFTITVDTTALSLGGMFLAAPFVSTFTTLRADAPSVGSIVPADRSRLISIGTTVVIGFTQPMATGSTEAAFQLTRPDGSVVAGTFSAWQNGDTILTFVPSAPLSYVVKYTVTIGTGATDLLTKALENPFVSTFTTARLTLDLISITPSAGPWQTPFVLVGANVQEAECYNITFNGEPALGTATVDPTATTITGCLTPATFAAGDTLVVVLSLDGQSAGGARKRTLRTLVQFVVSPELAALIAIVPSSGPPGTVLTITGTGLQQATCADFAFTTGGVTTALSGTATVTVTSDDVTIAGCQAPPAATGDVASLSVTLAGMTSSSGTFTYIPRVTTVFPNIGFSSEPLTIDGIGFALVVDCTALTVGSVACTGTAIVTDTRIEGCYAPAAPAGDNGTPRAVVVTAAGQASNNDRTFTFRPFVASITPTIGLPGDAVTVTGLSLGAAGAFNCAALSLYLIAATGTGTLTVSAGVSTVAGCVVPDGVPFGVLASVAVTLNGLSSNDDVTFGVAPRVISISPTVGPINTNITVRGQGFHLAPLSSVFVGPSVCLGTPYASGDGQSVFNCLAPDAETGAVETVVVNVGGGVAASYVGTPPTFTYQPSLTAVTPLVVPVRRVIAVDGTGLSSSLGATVLYIDGVACTNATVGVTHIDGCTVPTVSTGTMLGVSVVVAGQTSNTLFFTVGPEVTSIEPAFGRAGTRVLFRGTGLSGTSISALIAGVPCGGTLFGNGTTIVGCIVPAGLTYGFAAPVAVTVSGLAAEMNGLKFTFFGPPNILGYRPLSGLVLGGDKMFIFALYPSIFIDSPTLSVSFADATHSVILPRQNLTFLGPAVLTLRTPPWPIGGRVSLNVSNDGTEFSQTPAFFQYFSVPYALSVLVQPPDEYDNDGEFKADNRVVVQVVDIFGQRVETDAGRLIAGTFVEASAPTARDISARTTRVVKQASGVLTSGTTEQTAGGLAKFSEMQFFGQRARFYQILFECPGLLSVTSEVFLVLPCAVSRVNSLVDLSGRGCECAPGYEGTDTGICAPCGLSKFKSVPGDVGCQTCDPDRYTGITNNATNATQCLCRPGYFQANPPNPDCPDCCTNCTVGGYCPGGGSIVPALGYWRAADVPNGVLDRCGYNMACPGGSTRVCAPDYHGPLCGVCLGGRALYNGRCIDCLSNKADWAVLVGYALAWGALALGLVMAAFHAHDRHKVVTATILKIFVSYLHVLAFIGDYGYTWPDSIRAFLSLANVSTLSFGFITAKCTFALTFFDELIIAMAFPVFCVVLPLLLIMLPFYIKKSCGWARRTLRYHVEHTRIAIAVLLFYVHPSICDTVLRVFSCREIGGLSYLNADLSVECHTGLHQSWSIPAMVYFAIYCCGLPLAAMYAYFRNAKERNGPMRLRRHAFFTGGYLPEWALWDFAVLVRKIGVIAARVALATVPFAQVYTGIWVVAVALFLHCVCAPFDRRLFTLFEFLSLGATFMLLMGAELFLSNQFVEGKQDGSDAAASLLLLFAILVVILFLLELLREALRRCACRCPSCCRRCVDLIDRCAEPPLAGTPKAGADGQSVSLNVVRDGEYESLSYSYYGNELYGYTDGPTRMDELSASYTYDGRSDGLSAYTDGLSTYSAYPAERPSAGRVRSTGAENSHAEDGAHSELTDAPYSQHSVSGFPAEQDTLSEFTEMYTNTSEPSGLFTGAVES